jgi:hypothetical protein
MYELGSIARGLNAYINHAHPLRSLLPEQSIVSTHVVLDNVILDRPLIFAGIRIFQNAGTFEIKCSVRNQRQPQLILRAQEAPEWVYRQLERDIPQLTLNDLSFIGEDVAERLLNTLFPILDPELRLLKEAVAQLGGAFIQAVALADEQPIKQLPRVRGEPQAPKIRYQELPAQSDPFYPEDVEQIVARHQQQYGDRLNIVRGIVPLAGDQPDA